MTPVRIVLRRGKKPSGASGSVRRRRRKKPNERRSVRRSDRRSGQGGNESATRGTRVGRRTIGEIMTDGGATAETVAGGVLCCAVL